jgi:predicted AAA+ superfamily ATPase
MSKLYLPRIADRMLDTALAASGAVLIEGPKWCGKTWTAREKSKSQLYMQDPDYTAGYLKAADTKPSLLLRGETPRLIDEWQMAPVLWDAVRFTVDERGETGQFILTVRRYRQTTQSLIPVRVEYPACSCAPCRCVSQKNRTDKFH